MILSDTLTLPVSQLQTQQVMTSQIRSHIEYLTQTYYILIIIYCQNLWQKLASLTVFFTI